jgi:hypothetical protein
LAKRRIWSVVEPGWIKLDGTQYEIIYDEQTGMFNVLWSGKNVGSYDLLRKAKVRAISHGKEMREMGYPA